MAASCETRISATKARLVECLRSASVKIFTVTSTKIIASSPIVNITITSKERNQYTELLGPVPDREFAHRVGVDPALF